MSVRQTIQAVLACAAAGAMVGCSGAGGGRFGLGSATANAGEQVAADAIEKGAAGDQAQQASYDSGAGRQVGQAAGQELFNRTPYVGSALGGVLGSQVEKGVRSPAKPQAK